MSEKKPFVLRVDTNVLKAVEKWASDEFRSTNGQLEWMISEMLKKSKRMPSQTHKITNKLSKQRHQQIEDDCK